MILPLLRTLLLFVCTASAFAVSGRAPGAITLRTRELEASIAEHAALVRENRPGGASESRRDRQDGRGGAIAGL